ncbi:hypothetical protein NSQ62_07970 [Solibacillus sp. FSL H8-0523]|uniref:hypothetical protein n=1 Tax=Solibacillus sp. FSL H8-0523 TaxID=2954511 RepID=UPI003101672C
MNKKQELLNALLLYPKRRLVFMYSTEGNDDYAYSLGEIIRIEIAEMTVYNDERVIFNDEHDDLLEMIEDDIYSDKYGSQTINDEQNAEIHELAKVEIEKYEWESVIVVYVGS